MTSELGALTSRVERLEQQHRRLKSEVVTEKIVLMDSEGKARASLRLLASQTNAGLEMRAGDGGADISLFDASGTRRATLDVVPPAHAVIQELGLPALAMYNPNGTASVALTVVAGRGGLNLADAANLDTAIRLQLDDKGPIIACVKDGDVLSTFPE